MCLPVVISVCVACLAVAHAAPGVVRIEVEFLADGRCAVSASGDGVHASIIYLPPAASGLRCAIPPTPAGRPVDLVVRLPPGASPSGHEFPQLAWRERDDRSVGTAVLPAAPAFVSVPQAANGWWRQAFAWPASSTPFGWNFYGWFVFAAAFISVYFVWARYMARRDARRVR